MKLTVQEVKELGIDWDELCDMKRYNRYAFNEGLMDDDTSIDISVQDLKKLGIGKL